MPITHRSQPRAAPRGKPSAALPIVRDEKLTLNVGPVDLGQIDLLVSEGFFANRSDFIRHAIRQQLAAHSAALGQIVERQQIVTGLRHITADELRGLKRAREQLALRVLGLAVIDTDIDAALAKATIASLHVLGRLQASAEVRAALQGRIFE